MKTRLASLFAPILAASALAASSGAARADVTHLTSRDDVQAELVRLEHVGYRPTRNANDYPGDIQAARAKLDGQPGAARDTSGYGPSPAVAVQGGGALAPLAGPRGGVYAHH